MTGVNLSDLTGEGLIADPAGVRTALDWVLGLGSAFSEWGVQGVPGNGVNMESSDTLTCFDRLTGVLKD